VCVCVCVCVRAHACVRVRACPLNSYQPTTNHQFALMLQNVWVSAQQSEGQLFQTAVIHLDLQSRLTITTGQTGTRKCLSIKSNIKQILVSHIGFLLQNLIVPTLVALWSKVNVCGCSVAGIASSGSVLIGS